MSKRIVRDDHHDETYLVDDMGRECCESCGGPYEHLAGGWQHESYCPELELLTPDTAPTTVSTTTTVGETEQTQWGQGPQG